VIAQAKTAADEARKAAAKLAFWMAAALLAGALAASFAAAEGGPRSATGPFGNETAKQARRRWPCGPAAFSRIWNFATSKVPRAKRKDHNGRFFRPRAAPRSLQCLNYAAARIPCAPVEAAQKAPAGMSVPASSI